MTLSLFRYSLIISDSIHPPIYVDDETKPTIRVTLEPFQLYLNKKKNFVEFAQKVSNGSEDRGGAITPPPTCKMLRHKRDGH